MKVDTPHQKKNLNHIMGTVHPSKSTCLSRRLLLLLLSLGFDAPLCYVIDLCSSSSSSSFQRLCRYTVYVQATNECGWGPACPHVRFHTRSIESPESPWTTPEVMGGDTFILVQWHAVQVKCNLVKCNLLPMQFCGVSSI